MNIIEKYILEHPEWYSGGKDITADIIPFEQGFRDRDIVPAYTAKQTEPAEKKHGLILIVAVCAVIAAGIIIRKKKKVRRKGI